MQTISVNRPATIIGSTHTNLKNTGKKGFVHFGPALEKIRVLIEEIWKHTHKFKIHWTNGKNVMATLVH